MDRTPPEHVDRGIEHLLEGSIELAIGAQGTGGSGHGYVLARSSVMSTMFLVEASANALIDSLALPKYLSEDLERLRTISKFDLYCRLARNTAIDQGHPASQGVVDLMKLRNLYAHPRGIQVHWVAESEFSSKAESPRSAHLQMPKISSYVGPEHAVVALKAALTFIRYALTERCGHTSKEVNSLLFGKRRIPSADSSFHRPFTLKFVLDWLAANDIPVDHLEFQAIG